MNEEAVRDIVARIMTMHWDMKACECWVCQDGRAAGVRPNAKYLQWREDGYAFVGDPK